MKKVRITIKKKSKGKKFHIFNSPEALYIWLHDPDFKDVDRLDAAFGTTVTLRPGETMEVEWIGCEFIHEAPSISRIDHVRLAKDLNKSTFISNGAIGIHVGWTTENIVSFKSGGDEDITRFKLTSKSKHKFDIEELFEALGGKNKEPDHIITPHNLH